MRGPHSVSRFGIAAVPLERRGVVDIFEQAVVHDVFAEAVRLQVPLQAVEGRFEVAVGAAEVSLEGEAGAVEEPLAAALGRQRRRACRAMSVPRRLRAAVSMTEIVSSSRFATYKRLAVGREREPFGRCGRPGCAPTT